MYAIVKPGDRITMRRGIGRVVGYTVAESPIPRPGGLLLESIAANVDAGEDLDGSEELTLRTAKGVERRVRVGQTTLASIIVVPISMKIGPEGCDCPYCWEPSVQGESTGTSWESEPQD